MALFAKKLHDKIDRLATEYELLATDYSDFVQSAADTLEAASETLDAEMAAAAANQDRAEAILTNQLLTARQQSMMEKNFLLGKIDALGKWESRHNRLVMRHDWRIGGKSSAHGGESLIQWECATCPAKILAPEDFFL